VAWKAVIQGIGRTKLIRVPSWSDHLCNPGHVHSHVLLCDHSNLQWIPYAWLFDDLHVTPRLFARVR
jgi:hypothetical protein